MLEIVLNAAPCLQKLHLEARPAASMWRSSNKMTGIRLWKGHELWAVAPMVPLSQDSQRFTVGSRIRHHLGLFSFATGNECAPVPCSLAWLCANPWTRSLPARYIARLQTQDVKEPGILIEVLTFFTGIAQYTPGIMEFITGSKVCIDAPWISSQVS